MSVHHKAPWVHRLKPWGNLEPIGMFLDSGRNLEKPEEDHMENTERNSVQVVT